MYITEGKVKYKSSFFFFEKCCSGQKSVKIQVFNTRETVEDKPAEEREQFMAEQILKKNPDVHIGGLSHIFEGSALSIAPLYLRLGGAVLQRLRLNERKGY